MIGEFDSRETILVVDDSAESVALLNSMLKGMYRTRVALSGEKALEIASEDGPIDLILLDVTMPGMNGFETCRRLKENPSTADIPVMFLTSRTDAIDEEQGFELGAEDYISKPPSAPVVRARIRSQLRLKEIRDLLKDKRAYLESEVRRRTAEASTAQDATMLVMGSLAETRDNGAGNHLRRTQNYVALLARRLSLGASLGTTLTTDAIMRLYMSVPLHDIGKIGVPDRILNKPARLDPDEFAMMKKHAEIGRDAIAAAEQSIGSHSPFLSCAREIAWTHHERWDGSGYPRGLAGEAIPLSGRLMAVADVYDALTSERAYRKAFSHEEALEFIRHGIGTDFDPAVGAAFLSVADECREVSRVFPDGERRALEG